MGTVKSQRYKCGVCHVERVGERICTGNILSPGIYYWGYPTRERMEQEIIPKLIAMSNRGRMDVVFPLGIYVYARFGVGSFINKRPYARQVPDKSSNLLYKKMETSHARQLFYVQRFPDMSIAQLDEERKVVYFIDEEHKLYEVDRNGYLIS